MHWLAEVLTRADKDCEQHQNGGRVLAIQSIDQVVVEVVLEVAEVDGGFHEAVHLGAGDERVSATTTNRTLDVIHGSSKPGREIQDLLGFIVVNLGVANMRLPKLEGIRGHVPQKK